jgi:hypothetical protein
VPGSIEFDANNMSARVDWHDKKSKSDCSGLTDDPQSETFILKRLLGPSFVPIVSGKYMELVGAPAVGNQAAQFKAAVKLAVRYDAMPGITVRAVSDRGSITATDKASGDYEFVSDGSGAFELRFELSDAGGVFHTDRVRIEIPAIPGVGK